MIGSARRAVRLPHTTLSAAVLIASLSACAGDPEPIVVPVPEEDCAPSFEPSELNLGVVARNRTTVRSVELENRGTTLCRITEIESAGLSLVDPAPMEIAPGESELITLRLMPQEPDFKAKLDVHFESGDLASISVTATATDPKLLVVPSFIDFSNTSECPARPRPITVFNTLDEEIVVISAFLTARGDELAVDPVLSTRLSPGRSLELTVHYRPLRPDLAPSALQIDTSAGPPLFVEISGTGSTPCE
jgi:hypothetical protein